MSKGKIIEFLVYPILVLLGAGFFGWLAMGVSDIKSGQGEMRVDLGYTKERVDRIVQQVPTLRSQIAASQIGAPAREAVVTTAPVRRDSQTSVAAIHVLDLHTHLVTSYYVTLTNAEALMFNDAVAGAVSHAAPSAFSFGSMAEFVADSSVGASIPATVDRGSSFMIWSATDSVPLRKFRLIFDVDSTRPHSLAARSYNWAGVIQDIRSGGWIGPM